MLLWCCRSEIQIIFFRWHIDTMPPDCLIACGWWVNNRHKRGRRNVNQAADAWNQYYKLITCHEWPLRGTHVLSVEPTADSETTQILLPTSRTAHGPDLPPPTAHSRETACQRGDSSGSVGTSVHIGAQPEEICVKRCRSVILQCGPELEYPLQTPLKAACNCFKHHFQELTQTNLVGLWSQLLGWTWVCTRLQALDV